MSTDNTFDHIHLSEVDPNFSNIAPGVYTIQPQLASLAEFTYKQGERAGQTGQYVKFRFVVTDDETYSGRRLYESLFPNQMTFKILRRISDATGIQQETGEPLADWLTKLASEQPKFRVQIVEEPDLNRDGTPKALDVNGDPVKVNKVVWKQVLPA
jgi:hypothetical protein